MVGKPVIFPIVVTYKGQRWYERCFNSLRQSTVPVQTIVVDIASNDGTVEYIKEHYPEIHLIESKENLGFGRANNIAIRYALDHECDYVFLLNQDAWVEPDTLEKLIDIHLRHLEYGILGPVQVNAERTKVISGVIRFLVNPDNVNLDMFSDLIMDTVEEIYPVAEINAAAWLLPRKTLETVGGFDPIFLHYGEDWNYLSRVLYHGLKVGLTPGLKVVHCGDVRVCAGKAYEMSFDKWLLMRVTDLMYPDESVDTMIKGYRREMIQKALRFHKKTFERAWQSYKYLKTNSKAIRASREQNKKIGTNWL